MSRFRCCEERWRGEGERGEQGREKREKYQVEFIIDKQKESG